MIDNCILYKCNDCEKSYSSYKSLWKHNNSIHKKLNNEEKINNKIY
jgi:hypothetical protein